MKRLLLCLLGLSLVASAAFAGVGYSGKEMKQVAPPPCPEWYADREFNVSLWGTYVFTGKNWIDDRYIEADHAWGGGLDLKYFFMRYIGVGIEGWVVDARQARQDIFVDFSDGIFASSVHRESNAIGAVLGTLDPALSDSLHALCAVHFWRSWRDLWRGPEASQRALCRTGRRFRYRRDDRSYRCRDAGNRPGRRWHGNPLNSAHRLGQ